jgi:fucose permease
MLPVFIAFLLSGVGSTMLGPLLPLLGRRLELGDGGAGALFMALFGGAAVGSIGCGRVLEHWGYRRVLCTGYVLLGLGGAMMAAPSTAAVSMGILLIGFGLGLVIPGSNLLVAELSGERSASRLNWLNVCGGSGAVAGPPAVAWLRDATGLAGVAGLMCALALSSAIVLFRTAPATHVEHGEPGPSRRRFQLSVAILLFLYVGAETTLSGWLPTMAIRRAGAHSGLEALPLSAYWGAMMAGRGVAALLLRRYSVGRLMRVLLLGAPVAAASLALGSTTFGIAVCAALAGLFFGPVFPNAIAVLQAAFPAEARRLGPPVFAAASTGGAVVPWIAGWVSASSTDVRVILAPALVCLLLMAPVWRDVRRHAPTRN